MDRFQRFDLKKQQQKLQKKGLSMMTPFSIRATSATAGSTGFFYHTLYE
jgi:hypothetical protein